MQGANELLNNMFNIVREQNSHTLEVRLQRLEESLHNVVSRKNIVQEVILGKTCVFVPEPVRTMRCETPRRKIYVRARGNRPLRAPKET